MAHFHNNALVGASGQGGYLINQSLRFNDAYLSRTPSSAGNRRTFTSSVWLKKSESGAISGFWGAWVASAIPEGRDVFRFDSNSTFRIFFNETSNGNISSNAAYRDFSAWYHVVMAVDTTQATAANRVKLWINGESVSFGSATYPSQNSDLNINNTVAHYVGTAYDQTGQEWQGYMAEFNHVDGTALTPSSFGETDTITGAWIPKKYSGSYGTNGFYLKFDPSATNGIGHDHSGNGNNFTATGFSTSGTGTDVMSDTPTTNWCTLNPLNYASASSNPPYDGNLVARVIPNTTGFSGSTGTVAVSSGKWYYEIAVTAASGMHGIVGSDWTNNQNSALWWNNARGYGMYGVTGNKFNNGSNSSYGSAFSNGDIVQVAFDLNNGKVWFGINNTWQASGDPVAGTNAAFTGLTGEFVPVGYAQAANAGDNTPATFNFGQRAFAYTPPTGFKALNTANLPEPTIKKGGAHFNTVLYTGNDGTQTVSGVGFQPGLVWVKNRSNTASHWLNDAVRGAGLSLASDTTEEEKSYAAYFTAFNSDGFALAGGTPGFNDLNNTYASWNWKANGAGSSNTAGTITSTVSANATAGFSIVTWTAVSGGGTIGHGLGVAPSMVIVKSRNTGDWNIYHKSLGNTQAIYFTTGTPATSSVYWNNTSPTSSVFTVGSAFNTAGNLVSYCFSEVAGYSKFGSYTGNGSTDGPFVFCGFRPRWIMIKVTNVATTSWMIRDTARNPYNIATGYLFPNSSSAEFTNLDFDIYSNGFKPRHTNNVENSSGSNYIFAAFAELPAKYSNAR